MSDDEYFVNDDFADVNDVDWGAILGNTSTTAAPAPAPILDQNRVQPNPRAQNAHPQTSAFRPAIQQTNRNQTYQNRLNQPPPPPPPPRQPNQPRNVNQHSVHVPPAIPQPIPPAALAPAAVIPQTHSMIPDRAVSPASTNYFDDDDENPMDSSFLAELDRVERLAITRNENPTAAATTTAGVAQENVPANQAPIAINAQRAAGFRTATNQGAGARNIAAQPQIQRSNSEYILYGTQQQGRVVAPVAPVARFEPSNTSNKTKRPRMEEHTPSPFSPRKKGKMVPEDNVTQLSQVIAGYDQELNCPICCDIFVAAHSANPCGHSFCGECEWQWQFSEQNPKRSCPVCRQKLAKKTPMIPNISIDNLAENHVKALVLSGKQEWAPGGIRHKEWTNRKQKWREGTEMRANKSQPATKSASRTPVFSQPDIVQLGEIFFVDNEEDDSTYEGDSDVELVPRPIQRARRTNSRAHART